tara:strand:- start:643 stop:1056 length:414 start_codon:yes stop_codon:yes gene_type:complete
MKLEEPQNIGYETVLYFINVADGFNNRIYDVKECYPEEQNIGGIKFSYKVDSKQARFHIVLNHYDLFDCIASDGKKREVFDNLTPAELVATFLALVEASLREEEELLRSGVKLRHYREVDREMNERDIANEQGFQEK